MPDKDVNIHVRALEAEEAKRKIEGVAQSTEQMGDKTEEAGKKGARGMAAGAEKLAAYAAGAVSATAVLGLLTGAIRANSAAMTENAEIAEGQQQRLLRLQFLGDFLKEHPEARQEIAAYAEYGRRSPAEVSDAWYNLRSKGGFLDDTAQRGVLMEALELGRTDIDVSLDTMVDMFVLYMKKTGERDANKAQNVIKQTITEAGGGAQDVANQMTKFLPLGIAGKMTGAQAAGLWAYATTELGNPAEATTALSNVYEGLEGAWTPDRQKMLERLGVRRDMPFMGKLEALSKQDLTVEQLGTIAGAGGPMLASMTKNIGDLKRAMAAVEAADRADIDLTRQQIEEVFGSDEIARIEEDNRRLRVEIENLRAGDVEALRWSNKELVREVAMRRRGDAPYTIALQKKRDRLVKGIGGSASEEPDVPPDLWFGRSAEEEEKAFREGLETVEAEPPELGPSVEPTTVTAPLLGGPVHVDRSIHYDYSHHYQPVAGNREDRGIGPRVSQD
jgi:hypothetical protein